MGTSNKLPVQGEKEMAKCIQTHGVGLLLDNAIISLSSTRYFRRSTRAEG